jgi:hypothetical protein
MLVHANLDAAQDAESRLVVKGPRMHQDDYTPFFLWIDPEEGLVDGPVVLFSILLFTLLWGVSHALQFSLLHSGGRQPDPIRHACNHGSHSCLHALSLLCRFSPAAARISS